jgi:hypothetical protein
VVANLATEKPGYEYRFIRTNVVNRLGRKISGADHIACAGFFGQ